MQSELIFGIKGVGWWYTGAHHTDLLAARLFLQNP